MKYILLFILSLLSISAYSQVIYKIPADTVLIHKRDGTPAELNIENATKNIKGFLYNTGNGRTEFRSGLIKINDSTYIIGSDTLRITAPAATFDTTSLSNRINQKLNISDTLAMLFGYTRVQRFLDSLLVHNTKIDTKLTASDTMNLSSKVQASYKSVFALADSSGFVIQRWNGTQDTVLFTAASGSASLKNTGTGYNIAKEGTDSVKRFQAGYGVTLDSTTTANTIIAKVDTVGSNGVSTKWYAQNNFSYDTTRTGTYAQRITVTLKAVGQQFYQTNGLEGLYTWDGVSWVWNFGGSFRNFFDFTDGTTGFQGGTFTSGGSVSRSVLADSVGGGASMQTGTTVNGAAGLVYLLGTRNVGKDYNAYKYFTAARLIFNDSSTSSNRFIIRFGLSAAGASTYGENGGDLMFMYCDSINGGNWTVKNINNSGTTTHNINTGIFAQTKRIYHLLIVTDYQTGQHYCYIDNVLGATIPITDHNTLGSQLASIRKTAGTASRSFVLRESYQFVKYKSQ